ncbi:MAG TPA: glycosyltransferase [Solirubrobacteraceae bacterium]|jgi:GT2 family glycosyltransferase
MVSIVIVSKDERALDETLAAVADQARGRESEIVVVDASEGRLADVQRAHPGVRWIDYAPPPGVAVSIPHQRNAGVRAARGDVIVFTDAGCRPRPGWLAALLAPIDDGSEDVVAGRVGSPEGRRDLYESWHDTVERSPYLSECPTINLAFRRSAFDAVDGFDERFEYGSDIDFSWRLVAAGRRIRTAPGAVVEHDWGSRGRRLKRAYAYGRARARLYRKHRRRLLAAWRADPMVLVYPTFLLGLPLTARFPLYPALLAIPAWRNRADGPLRVLADHLAYGAGVLSQVVRP